MHMLKYENAESKLVWSTYTFNILNAAAVTPSGTAEVSHR